MAEVPPRVSSDGTDAAARASTIPESWSAIDPWAALFETAPTPYLIYDVDGRRSLANRKALELFGFESAASAWVELLGRTHPDDRDAARRDIAAIERRAVDQVDVERRLLRLDGSMFHCRLQVRPLLRDDNIHLLLLVVEDVSEHVAVQRAWADSETRFRALVQHAADTIVLVDGRGLIRYASPAGEKILGEPMDDVVGRHILEFVHEDDRDVALDALASTLVRPGPGELLSLRVPRADGSVRTIEVLSNNFLDDPSIDGIVMNVRDVTDVVEARNALESNERRIRRMLENISDTVTLVDAQADVITSTGNLKSIMGWAPAFWEGRNGFDVLHPDDRAWTEEALIRLLQNPGVEMSGEVRTATADGGWIDAEISAINLLDDPDVAGIVLTTRNITERKRAERELASARDEALGALRARTEFIANVSHELRTPIHGILGLSELLASSDLDDDARGLARSIGRATEALRMVLDDILDFAKIEVGRLEVTQQPIDVFEMADDVYQLFLGQARAKGIELTRSVERGFPRSVMSDPLRIRQVLHNLIGNAVKFTTDGSVHVDLRRGDPGPDGQPRLRLTVTDTGMGIPAESHDQLFQPFSQIHGDATRELGGTGLGLSIAKRLVDLLGGDLDFSSTVGEGSSFWFVLPLVETTAEQAADRDAAGTPEAVAVGTAGRVLVVEDNPINQLLVRRQLERLGYEPVVVDSGLAALDEFPAAAASAVLMDWQLPGIDGLETTRRLRQWEIDVGRRRTPIIAMTASALPGDRERCLRSGMDEFLAKPVSIHALGETLARWAQAPPDPGIGEGEGDIVTAPVPAVSAVSSPSTSSPNATPSERDHRAPDHRAPDHRAPDDRAPDHREADDLGPDDLGPAGRRPSTTPVVAAAAGDALAEPAVPPALVSLLDELDDAALVESIVRTYLRELPGRVGAIRSAVADGSAASLSASVHLLKSTSAAVGATGLAELCAVLEGRTTSDEDAASVDLGPMDDAVARAEKDLDEAIARLEGR